MKRAEAIRDLDIIRFNPHWDELVNEEYWQELMEMAITALQNQPVWIPVSERLPEERDSVFKKFKGTSKWNPMMFEKTSGYVIATVEYMDRTRLTTRAHTADGIWKADNSLMTGKVIAWMPLPEPYRESEEENGKMGN